MKGLFTAALCLLLTYSASAQCPEGAVNSGVIIGVGLYRANGFLMGSRSMAAGETVRVQLVLMSHVWDTLNDAPIASYGGGKLTVSINGKAFDVTPDGGVGTVGACGSQYVRSKVLNYTASASDGGRLWIAARYEGTALLWCPMPISANSVTVVAVH